MGFIDLPFDLEPKEAVEFFRSKDLALSFGWQDVWREAHVQAFTVAKVARLDILADIHAALDQAKAKGTEFGQFRAELEPILRAKGWWGKKEMADPLTGEVKKVWLGTPWRLQTIYRANLQSAYSAGRYQQMLAAADARPYWQYSPVNDARVRPEHAAWRGVILPFDNPWWRTHYPPNGWNCRCAVVSLSARQMESRGLEVSEDPPQNLVEITDKRTGQTSLVPRGIDPGWDYNPGQAWMEHYAPRLTEKLQAAPPALSHAALRVLANSEPFQEFLQAPQGRGWWPVLRLPPEAAKAIGAKGEVAALSSPTAAKNLAHHPDLTPEDYAALPELGSRPDYVIQDGPHTLVLVQMTPQPRWAAVKATESGQGLFVTSFRRTNEKNLELLLKKGKLLGGEE